MPPLAERDQFLAGNAGASKAVRFLRWRSVQHLPAMAALRDLSRTCLRPAFDLTHVPPMEADGKEEKPMTTFEFAFLINGLARLIAALAKIITAIRRKDE